ncbi:MAG: glycosyltransferase [Flavobacteriales bacterium]|nr:glycosyltransferase [Flavobacteriales bacterium]
MKHIVFTVTNDLTYDQRMQRICTALSSAGFRCTLIGRERSSSAPLANYTFQQVRLGCWFEKGKLFYLEYNARLLLHLLRYKPAAFCAIDLDTALPVYFVSRMRNLPFVFDSHEYFSELEEVVTRPLVHKVWQWVEQFIMKRFDVGFTISTGYASLFKGRYNADFAVVRNVPVKRPISQARADANPYLIYQGALNVGRGLQTAILAMKNIDGLALKIYGDGPIRTELQTLIKREGLQAKVELCGPVPPEELRSHTQKAFAGLTLFSSKGLHHQYSLANRFFDYFHSGIPQIAIDHHEYRSFNDAYDIAFLIADDSIEQVTAGIKKLQSDVELYERLRANCSRAADENNWQKESISLTNIYKDI